MPSPEPGGGHEAAAISSRALGGAAAMAVRGARAAGGDAVDRLRPRWLGRPPTCPSSARFARACDRPDYVEGSNVAIRVSLGREPARQVSRISSPRLVRAVAVNIIVIRRRGRWIACGQGRDIDNSRWSAPTAAIRSSRPWSKNLNRPDGNLTGISVLCRSTSGQAA